MRTCNVATIETSKYDVTKHTRSASGSKVRSCVKLGYSERFTTYHRLLFFFLNDTAPPEISPLSLHDALPISRSPSQSAFVRRRPPLALVAISLFYLLRMPDTLVILRSQQLGVSVAVVTLLWAALHVVRSTSDRKSTRLNSSHSQISYAVFCLK